MELVIKNNFLLRLLKLASFSSLSFNSKEVMIDGERIRLENCNFKIESKFLLPVFFLENLAREETYHWLGQSEAYSTLIKAKNERVGVVFNETGRKLQEFYISISSFLNSEQYIDNRHVKKFVHELGEKEVFTTVNIAINIRDNPDLIILEGNQGESNFSTNCDYVRQFLDEPFQVVEKANAEFIENERKTYKNLFSNIEDFPLSDEQEVACIAMEENNQLIAAAGSGKTSTLVGKIAYALEKGLFKEDEILCLAFNGAAAREIEQRLRLKIKRNIKVKSKTFHSLGLSIIAKKYGYSFSVLKEGDEVKQTTSETVGQYYKTSIINLLRYDNNFRQEWIKFHLIYRFNTSDVESFDNAKAYYTQLNFITGQRKYGNLDGVGIRTLAGFYVRSIEEVSIANWLYINGVKFVYEPINRGMANKLNYNYYHPDFYYENINFYHEHFALDENGKAPKFFDNPIDYEKRAKEKIEGYAESEQNFFYTTSADFRAGILFNKLEEFLLSAGVKLNPMSFDELESELQLIEGKGKNSTRRMLEDSVKYVKSNNLSHEQVLMRYESARNKPRAKVFTNLIFGLKTEYENLLKAKGKIDFATMIEKAILLVESGEVELNYKFILADECQDLSLGFASLLRSMLNQHNDAVLFAVGDDWQSINGFTGSDLSIFNGFKDYFGYNKEMYLTNTFRSNQGIADIAANFVQKDGYMKKKAVRAVDSTTNEVLSFIYCDHNNNDYNDTINVILNDLSSKQEKTSVFILARYKSFLPDTANYDEFPNLTVTKMSIHKSKGLQADVVILIGMINSKVDKIRRSFPSSFNSDELTDCLLPKVGYFDSSDERRLMYVALTRAKHKVYVLRPNENSSQFCAEIINQNQNTGSIVTKPAGDVFDAVL